MAQSADPFAPETIDRTDARTLFAELVHGALDELELRISPTLRSYLIQLLERQLHGAEPALAATGSSLPDTATALVDALSDPGLEPVPTLRVLGDRALFVGGFFRPHFRGRRATANAWAEIGRAAYADIAGRLADCMVEASWPRLFGELAGRFDELESLLAEVGEFARPDPDTELLKIYDRYARTGSIRDRAILVERGLVPPPRAGGLLPC